jgi:hypothetical protein
MGQLRNLGILVQKIAQRPTRLLWLRILYTWKLRERAAGRPQPTLNLKAGIKSSGNLLAQRQIAKHYALRTVIAKLLRCMKELTSIVNFGIGCRSSPVVTTMGTCV